MAVAKSDTEDAKKKLDDEAQSSGEDFQRADDDASDADASLNDEDTPEAAADGDMEDDEGEPMGEFRVQVMQNGNVRLVLDQDPDEDDVDDSEASDQDDAETSDASAPEDDLNRSEDATKDDSKNDKEKDKDKDLSMDKSQSAPDARRIAVTQESLSKALEAVMRIGESQDAGARLKGLLAKAQTEQGLSKSEAKELFAGMAKPKKMAPGLAERVRKSLQQDKDLQKSQLAASQDHDVAAYLDAKTDAMVKGFSMVADAVDASSERGNAFALVLAKAVGQIGTAVKLIGERMQVIESQPARQPKSLSARPLDKSFAGAPSEAPMDSAAAIDTLTRMNMESRKSGHPGLTKGHRPIMDGIERVMNNQPLDAGLMEEVKAYRRQQSPA